MLLLEGVPQRGQPIFRAIVHSFDEPTIDVVDVHVSSVDAQSTRVRRRYVSVGGCRSQFNNAA